MEGLLINIVFGVGGVLGGVFITMFVFGKNKAYDFEKKKRESEQIVQKSKEEAEKILEENEKRTERINKENEEDFKVKEERQKKFEESVNLKQSILDKKLNKINEAKLGLASFQEEVQGIEEKAKRTEKDFIVKLTSKTGTTESAIKERIIKNVKVGHFFNLKV